MNLNKLLAIRTLAATGFIAAALPYSIQLSAATTISKNFESIKETIPTQVDKVESYFVRVELEPVVVWLKSQEAADIIVTDEAKQAYISEIKAELAKVMEQAQLAGFETSSPVVATDVGFSIFATKTQAVDLSDLSQVKAVVPKPAVSQQRTYSTNWIGGTFAHDNLGLKGSGQTIAVIDTGIDYFHSDFSGSGDPLDFLFNDPATVEPDSFPTATVIGGYDFAGFDYDARFAETSIPRPDADPVDDGIHGSHVAGIAAGRGIGEDSATGIAPEASLYALKVFGADGSTTLTSQAIEMAIDPDGDGDPSDAVDVINMSLGAIFGDPENSTSVSAQNAVEMGTVVVAAAGNAGNDIPYISGSPGSAEGVIAVASSISGDVKDFFLRFTSSSGVDYEFVAPYAAISPKLTDSIAAPLTIAEPYDGCTEISNDFNGDIALITRGTCAFTLKLSNAAAAGASAAVVVNNVAGPAITMAGDDVDIPGAMITLTEGSILLAELNSETLAAEFALVDDPSNDDTISTFSSRGPGPTGLFKPDVTAPGDQIESAFAGTGDATLTISGTSMAAPQVAGMAALLREQFPDLGPKAIKAIIQNTARPASILDQEGTPPLSLQGSGIVDIEKALAVSAYAAPGGIGFGVFKPEYNDTEIKSIEVTNFSEHDQRFSISLEANQGSGSSGVIVDVPQEVFVAAGQTASVPLTLRIQADKVEISGNFQEFDGWVVFTSDQNELRVGYMAVVEPASIVNMNRQGNTYYFQNTAFGTAEIYGYTAPESAEANFGFSSLSAETVEFAFNADEDWTQFAQYELLMTIDDDEDGIADHLVVVADLNTIAPAIYDDVTGTIASAIFDLELGGGSLLYIANANTNNSLVQFLLDAYGDVGFLAEGDTDFDYSITIENTYAEGGSVAFAGSGSIDLSEQATIEFPAFALPSQQNFEVDVTGSAEPIFFIPTESKADKRVFTD